MYQALYRKWRPKTFDDVVGQEHISETLKRQVVSGRLTHAYLFVGTRGTGKTTCAKILARAINCTNPQNGNPCNKCASCIGIDNGSIMDVMELDAASNNGVDNVRALREEAVYTPADVKKRVYIIDEVHMLSTAAFNALLKILEEPPPHLIFILATTEIHKVPATILSRCQRYTFKRLLPEVIARRLQYVAGQENITLTDEAAALLARLADGSLRDGLSLLDQCASESTVDYDRVLSAIGLAGSEEVTNLLTAIVDNDPLQAISLLDKLYSSGKVMSSVIEQLLTLVRDILMMKMMPKGGSGLLSGNFDQPALSDFAQRLPETRLLSMADTLREAMLDFAKDSGGRLAAELCLIRLTAGAYVPVQPAGGAAFFENIPRREVPAATIQSAPAVPPPAVSKPPVPTEVPAAQPPFSESKAQAVQQPVGETVHAPAAAVSAGAQGDAWKQILALIKPEIDIPPYSFLSDPTQTSPVFEEQTLTIKTKTEFPIALINVTPVTTALKGAAMRVLNKPVAIRVILDTGTVSAGSDKLDALKKFPNIKFE